MTDGYVIYPGEVDVNPRKGTKFPIEVRIPFSFLKEILEESEEDAREETSLDIPGLSEGILQFIAQELVSNGVSPRSVQSSQASSQKRRDSDDDSVDWECPEHGSSNVRKNFKFKFPECGYYDEIEGTRKDPPDEDELPKWAKSDPWWDKDERVWRAYCKHRQR